MLFRSLFNGLSAGLQRQMCFASVRLGLYDTVRDFYTNLIYGKQYKPFFKDLIFKSQSLKMKIKKRMYFVVIFMMYLQKLKI